MQKVRLFVRHWLPVWCSAAMLVASSASAQTPQIFLDGQYAGTIGVAPLEIAVLDVIGAPQVPFALRIAFGTASIPTPYGTFGLDPADPEAFNLFDGFDPAHFAYLISMLGAGGSLTAICIPFTEPGQTPGFQFFAQAYVNDPGSPAGATLTNVLTVESGAAAPVISGSIPNCGTPDGPFYVSGENFSPVPGHNAVAVDGRPCEVLASSMGGVQIRLPSDARSGPIGITTPWGTVQGASNALASWCAVVTGVLPEGTVPTPVVGRVTVMGTLSPAGSRDAYLLHADAGQEIFVEAYSFDPVTGFITEVTNTVNSYFDPVVRIKRDGLTLVQDDDSGPGVSAGIGLGAGANWFVADQTGIFTVEIDTYLSAGGGTYLATFGTRAPETLPPMVIGVFPNLARAGDQVSVLASGLVPSDPAGHALTVNGAAAQILQIVAGRIDFLVPAGARSGPVDIVTPAGATQHPIERLSSWLCVLSPAFAYETEGLTQYLADGSSIIGDITSSIDVDTYRLQAAAGHRYRIEVSAFDPAISRVVGATFLGITPVDPDLRISTTAALLPYLAIDGNGGPGFNALVGNGAESAPFLAPATGEFNVMVSSWFSISRGGYVINVWDVTP